jgi:hypothetical protein
MRERKAGRWWLTPVILAAQEAAIRRILIQSQPWANSLRNLAGKKKKKIRKRGWWSAQVA